MSFWHTAAMPHHILLINDDPGPTAKTGARANCLGMPAVTADTAIDAVSGWAEDAVNSTDSAGGRQAPAPWGSSHRKEVTIQWTP